jgi:hypothetical protein
VRVNDGEHVEAFMAVNKRFVRTLRILDEGGRTEPRLSLKRRERPQTRQISIVPCR